MFWFEESIRITPELAQSLKMLLALPVVGMYCSIGAMLLGLFIVAYVGALKLVARVQWSTFRSWKGRESKKKSNKVVLHDEKTCPLMPPVTTGEHNSKMADISVT